MDARPLERGAGLRRGAAKAFDDAPYRELLDIDGQELERLRKEGVV